MTRWIHKEGYSRPDKRCKGIKTQAKANKGKSKKSK
jgi:hypothetical protein